MNFQANMLKSQLSNTLTDLVKELAADQASLAMFAEAHPTLWDDLADQGYECLDLQQLPQAAQIFALLTQACPEEVAFHAAYADALHGMARYQEAAVHYAITIELEPNIADAYFYMAEIHILNQELDQAAACLAKVIALGEFDRIDVAQQRLHNINTLKIAA